MYLKWASHFWFSTQNFIFPERTGLAFGGGGGGGGGQGFALKEGGTPLPTQHSSYNSSQRHALDPNITPNRFSNRQ